MISPFIPASRATCAHCRASSAVGLKSCSDSSPYPHSLSVNVFTREVDEPVELELVPGELARRGHRADRRRRLDKSGRRQPRGGGQDQDEAAGNPKARTHGPVPRASPITLILNWKPRPLTLLRFQRCDVCIRRRRRLVDRGVQLHPPAP